MAHLPTHSYALKRHNCLYKNSINAICSGENFSKKRAKSLPSRPATRRCLDDTPSSSLICSTSLEGTGFDSARTSQEILKNSSQKLNDKQYDKSICEDWTKVMNRNMYTCPGVKNVPGNHQKFCIDERVETKYIEPNEVPKYNSPSGTPNKDLPITSAPDHEYLQFLLKITEDIIQNDLYTNKEMKKVFLSHINANKERLLMDRMLLQVKELMKELSMPLSGENDADASPSWTEIENAMKNVSTIEKLVPKCQSMSSTTIPEKKCVCIDLRNLEQQLVPKEKTPDEELIEEFDTDEYGCMIQLKCSLDRLSEKTEPNSSQVTHRMSAPTSCSTFGTVDVLPGFECLETPKISIRTICDDPYEVQSTRPQSLAKRVPKYRCGYAKKSKTPKRRVFLKSKNKKHICTTSSQTPRNENNTNDLDKTLEDYEKQLILPPNLSMKIQKPFLISLQESRNSDNEIQTLCVRDSVTEYVLVNGPMYILKTFLEENSNMMVTLEMPPKENLPAKSITNSINEIKKFNSIIFEYSNEKDGLNMENNLIEETQAEPVDENNDIKNNNSCTENIINNGRTCNAEKDGINKYEENISFEGKLTIPDSEIEECVSNDNPTIDVCEQAFIDLLQPIPQPYDITKKIQTNPFLYLNNQICYQCNKITEHDLENKLITNDYDLTPQKEHHNMSNSMMNKLIGDEYKIVDTIVPNFFTSREIQTEYFHHDPVIVAMALLSNDKDNAKSNCQTNMSTNNDAKNKENVSAPHATNEKPKNDEPSTSKNAHPATIKLEPERLSIPRKVRDSLMPNQDDRKRSMSLAKSLSERLSVLDPDSRKRGESIMRSIQAIKERQANKEKTIQGIKAKLSMSDSLSSLSRSIEEFDSKVEYSGQQSVPISSLNTGCDDLFPKQQEEDEVTKTQQQHMDVITTKLQRFVECEDKDEQEVSDTLDKLVSILKSHQKLEEENRPNEESLPVYTTSDTVQHSSFNCCRCSKKKKKLFQTKYKHHSIIKETDFSESAYKIKSLAFELALASLGQETNENAQTESKENATEAKSASKEKTLKNVQTKPPRGN